MQPIALDYETFYSTKLKYTIRGSIAESYCSDERFDPYMVSVCDGSTTWSGESKRFNWESIHGRVLLAHNARFDSTVFAEMKTRGMIPKHVEPAGWLCTADMTSYLCNRRALDDAVEHLLKVKISKAARSDANNKRWPQDFTEAERKTMIEYARGDVVWCHRLFTDFGGKWPEVERRLSTMTRIQGQRGVQINQDLLNHYVEIVHKARQETEKLLPWLETAWDEDDEFNTKPTSTKCVAEQCRRVGIPCPPVKADDEEGYLNWEATHSPKQPWIIALSSWRSLNKTYKSLLTVKARLRADGSLPFALKYFGAHTGRWSGDAGINFQNFRKVPILIRQDWLMEVNESVIEAAVKCFDETSKWPEWVREAIDIRNLIVPRDGKKMIVCDLSQIEPRLLLWLVKDFATLDLLKGGMSIYEAFARANMGWTGGKLKDENPSLYALVKAQVLGLGYGCGWEKFITVARTMAGIDITKDDPEWLPVAEGEKPVSGYGQFSRKVVADYRAANPKIAGDQGIWRRLDCGLRSSVGKTFTIRLPSGRAMNYDAVRSEARMEPNEKGEPVRRYRYTASYDGRRKETYGGKLCENLVQATARDVFGEQLVRMEDKGLTALFTVHDEGIFEMDPSVKPADIEHEMSYIPEWLPGCPIGAEAHEVPHYIKL